MRISRAKKSALNQESESVKNENFGWTNPEPEQDNEKIIEELEKNHDIDNREEIDDTINTELPTLEEVEDDIEKEEQNPDEPLDNDEELPKVEKKKEITKQDLMKLSKAGLRHYQRTGKLPQ